MHDPRTSPVAMGFHRATADDLENLAALYVEVFGAPPWNEEWPVAAALARLTEIHQTPGSLGLVARLADGVVGFALGFTETYNDGRDFYIKEMCISPHHQRRGIGSALLAELEKQVRADGARKVYLLTSKGGSAEAFYASNDYYVSNKMIMMGHWLRPQE